MNTGIYAIRCIRNGRHYVGQTSRPFSVREREHWGTLRAGKHKNDRLQSDWKRYGERAFSFVILERGDRHLNDLERLWLLRLQAEYNDVWPGTPVPIQRNDRGRIIPLEHRTKKPATGRGSLDWLWFGVGAAIALVMFS